MNSEILNAANKYAIGLKNVEYRREQWLKKHLEILAHLKEIANYLNANSTYKQPFYVDKNHAFNEDINGTCVELPSITFRTGEMPMMVIFKNVAGDKKEYFEEGFRITFSPTITGQIVVMILPHYNNFSHEQPQFKTMAVINDIEQISMDVIDQIILKGIEFAFYSSYTGISEFKNIDGQQQTQSPLPPHNPIGFKRYETTEKIS